MSHGRVSRRPPAHELGRRRGVGRRGPTLGSVAILVLLGGCAPPSSLVPPRAATPSYPDAGVPTVSSIEGDLGSEVAQITGERDEATSPTLDIGAERLRRLYRQARLLVEEQIDADLSEVPLELVDDREILTEVRFETNRLVRGQVGDGPLAERLVGTLMAGRSGTYAALYSGQRRSVMLNRELLADYLASLPAAGAFRDEALLVLMLHELVHAADDLLHGIHAKSTPDFRASFARSAAFEGHAQWLTRVICKREDCLGGLAALDAFMFGEHDRAEDGEGGGAVPAPTARSAPVDRNLLEYSYVEGERFVTALAARPDGAALIERLLIEPPHDPLQILDPASFPDAARERRNRALLAAARQVSHPWLDGPDLRVAIATSPLKGVDLRADEARREAAIDGFTRLIRAMVAVQFHDPDDVELAPVEVTLMRTDRPDTARLFADTLHAHALTAGATTIAATKSRTGSPALLRTSLPAASGRGAWRTAIATDGIFVVQASGWTGPPNGPPEPLDDYVLGALATLTEGSPSDG
mgnify:CR=1 FL=1